MCADAQLGYFISLFVYVEFGSVSCSSVWCGLLWFDFVWLLSCFQRMSAIRTATGDHRPSLLATVLYFPILSLACLAARLSGLVWFHLASLLSCSADVYPLGLSQQISGPASFCFFVSFVLSLVCFAILSSLIWFDFVFVSLLSCFPDVYPSELPQKISDPDCLFCFFVCVC